MPRSLTPQGKPSKLSIDKRWFEGLEKEKEIRASRITDHDDDPKCGVHAHFKKTLKRPIGLAGLPE